MEKMQFDLDVDKNHLYYSSLIEGIKLDKERLDKAMNK
jgi:hypothetical protein